LISKSLAFAEVLPAPTRWISDNRTLAKVCSLPSNVNGLFAFAVTFPSESIVANLSSLSLNPLASYAVKVPDTISFTILNSAVIFEPVKFLFPSSGFNTTVPFPASTLV
jgi:hypothetical protein